MRIEVRLIGYWVVSRGNKGVRSGGPTPRSGLAFASDSEQNASKLIICL